MTAVKPADADQLRITVVKAVIKRGRAASFQVGWLPSEGWICGCPAGRRPCVHKRLLRDQLCDIDPGGDTE